MNTKIKIIVLTCILVLATALRLWQLGSVPPSPDWDEAALAYDAHSLFVTGRDEFGNFLPAVLRSFDDYKPAAYAYLAIPTVEIFGLNTFAVRLPSALLGILAVLATYFLVKELFQRGQFREKKYTKYVESIALTSAFLLAISPWHIQFSRIAFESNVGLTFNILAALFFIKGLKNHWLLIPSLFLAGLNLSVYQSERVFTPLLMLMLTIVFFKEVIKVKKRYLFAAASALVITIVPIVMFFTHDSNAFLRIKGTSIFNNQTEILKKTITRLAEDSQNNDVIGGVLDNRRVTYVKSVASAYIAHFDPNWLFIKGDNNRHHAPRMGLIYIIFLPFILLGIYHLIFGNYDRKTKSVIFAWFLLAPVPASITTGVPHAVRTLNTLPMYEIFIALGLLTSFIYLAKYKQKLLFAPVKYVVFGFLGILFSFNFIYYLNQYFVQQNYYYAYDWQYGYEEAIPVIESMKHEYRKVVVSDGEPLDKSYMFFLFYLKYPPAEYQKLEANKSGSFASMHAFDKYEFRKFEWDNEKSNKDVLYVGSLGDFSDKTNARKIIYYPNGEPAIMIVDPKHNQ